MTRRVLLISYTFPPTGGAGVQRVTKFTKYLPQMNWDVSVLTVANPSVPTTDESLLKDVPESTLIRRAKSLEPSYKYKASLNSGAATSNAANSTKGTPRGSFLRNAVKSAAGILLQPDPQILWARNAVREGRRLLNELRHDAIIVSAPPFSAFLIGAKLSRLTKLPLILDYRDEWDISTSHLENKSRHPFSRLIQQRMQHRVMRQASAIIATTQHSAGALQEVARRAQSTARVHAIYNGYDPDDFAANTEPRRDGIFRIAYTGTLWNLTNCEPLVRALELLAATKPDVAQGIEVTLAGRCAASQQPWVEKLRKLPCRLVEKGYLSHPETIQLMQASNVVCALLAGVPEAARVVPAKIFEYMAAHRPILLIAPRGECWKLLEGHPAAGMFDPSDIQGIAGWLEQEAQGQRQSGCRFNYERFSRKHEAGQLAALLEEVASPKAAPVHIDTKTSVPAVAH